MAQEILNNIWGEPQLQNTILVAGLAGFCFDRVPLSPAENL